MCTNPVYIDKYLMKQQIEVHTDIHTVAEEPADWHRNNDERQVKANKVDHE